MPKIHPTAIVDLKAELDTGVEIGPYSIVGPNVKIGSNTSVGPHTVIEGHTNIGQDNVIFQFCSLGAIPQDKKYAGELTTLEIGHRNTIREFCTFNLGVVGSGGLTKIGNDNWIMAYVHIAHDCLLGNYLTIANAVQLGGHVQIDDWATIGGLTGIHQFVRVGKHAMIGFQTRLSQDLPPFVTASGSPAEIQSINQEGLQRRNFSHQQILQIKQMYRLIYRQGYTLEQAKTAIHHLKNENNQNNQHENENQYIDEMLNFLQKVSRGIVR
jgi:UDP-N-acetylglucosamine acyltransferase